MRHDKFSNVKISKLSASPESEHLNNEKKNILRAFPLTPIFEIQTVYE